MAACSLSFLPYRVRRFCQGAPLRNCTLTHYISSEQSTYFRAAPVNVHIAVVETVSAGVVVDGPSVVNGTVTLAQATSSLLTLSLSSQPAQAVYLALSFTGTNATNAHAVNLSTTTVDLGGANGMPAA